jgi:hypothetical protein
MNAQTRVLYHLTQIVFDALYKPVSHNSFGAEVRSIMTEPILISS